MTYEEYTQLDRDAQVRACMNDLALVAAGQHPVPNGPQRTEDMKLEISAAVTALEPAVPATVRQGIPGRFKAVALKSGTKESTVRRVLEAYEEIEALRRS